MLRGPGGTITIDDSGIKLNALEIRLKGPVVIEEDGTGNELHINAAARLAAELDGEFCLTCFLRAAQSGSAMVSE